MPEDVEATEIGSVTIYKTHSMQDIEDVIDYVIMLADEDNKVVRSTSLILPVQKNAYRYTYRGQSIRMWVGEDGRPAFDTALTTE